MTPLLDHLARRIRADGPIGIAEYMAEALTHPEHGYYSRQDPFGAAGDFITAPEISQMFGELIGLWCVDTWRNLGAPAPLRLVELGPGRGTLMADLLRAARLAPAFLAAADVHLVEVSPALRARQRQSLAGTAVTWHDDLAGLPDGPLLLIANEFFDALPIRQYQRLADGWAERLIGFDDARQALAFGLGPVLPPFAHPELPDAPEGAIAEVCPAGRTAMREIARRLAAHGGAALVIDYGYGESQPGDSLQALRAHRPHAVLESPGEADLTAHVDFAALARAARTVGAEAYGPVTQGAFLEALGIAQRAERLCRQATPAQAQDIEGALKRLTEPQAMGSLFKVMAVTAPGAPGPAGFPISP